MTAFCSLSVFIRSLFAFWSICLMCVGIACVITSFVVRRYRQTAVSLLCFLLSYGIWQIIMDLNRYGAVGQTGLDAIPWGFWLIALLLLTGTDGLSLFLTARYLGTFINPLTIKICADRMNCGICYWRDNGRVIFANRCMNELCISMTGRTLMNGNTFRDRVTTDIFPVLGRKWKFDCRDLVFGKEPLHEMIAHDVTEIQEETETLRKANEKLSALKDELRAYSLRIDDTVRGQETLQAKVNIHDEMNRLMLWTTAADISDTEEMNRILSLWKKNALLLCREADEKKGGSAAENTKMPWSRTNG